MLSEKIKWQSGIARSYYYWGDYYYRKGDFVDAHIYLDKGFEASFSGSDDEFAVKLSSYAAAAIYYQGKKADQAISYLLVAADRFKKIGKNMLAAENYIEVGDYNQFRFNYGAAIEYYNKGLQLAETTPQKYLPSRDLVQIADLYLSLHNANKAKALLLKAAAAYKKAGDRVNMANNYLSLAGYYYEINDFDGAIACCNKAMPIAKKLNDINLLARIENGMGSDYLMKKDYDKAYIHARRSMAYTKANPDNLIGNVAILGIIYRDAPDSVIKKAGLKPGQRYEKSVALLTRAMNYRNGLDVEFTEANLKDLSLTYQKMHRYADAFKTYTTYITKKDSTDSLKNEKAIVLKEAEANYSHKEDSLRYAQNITNAELKQKKQQSYFFIGGIAGLLILSVVIALNYNNQRKSNKLLAAANDQVTNANHELSEQREEITSQRDQLVVTVANLKTAQQQLIQSEKMASLGELTAGIAHEIQNPLNFVNNFSEVNLEMLEELKAEIKKPKA